MFSEKDFERQWFFYKTEGDPKGLSINLVTTFYTRYSMTSSRKHRRRLYLYKWKVLRKSNQNRQ